MNKLFEKPGKKVKTLALVVFWLTLIASVVGFIILLTFEEETLSGIAFGVLIGGAVTAWVGSVILYAFGQLVEDIAALRAKVDPAPAPVQVTVPAAQQEEASKTEPEKKPSGDQEELKPRTFLEDLL